MLKIGYKAPYFEGVTQDDKKISLDDFAGKKLILYFYPKDNTSGKAALAEMGFEIVGVSPDSVRSHQNFCNKHELNFSLIADTEKEIAEAYGVWKEKSMYGRKYMGIVRTTFIIDEKGLIVHIFDKVKTATHWEQIAEWAKKELTAEELVSLYPTNIKY